LTRTPIAGTGTAGKPRRPSGTPATFATFFKVSRNWVYQQAELGKIPCVRIGGLLRFDPEKIKALGNGELLPLSRARLK
jgi:hypothetical protein